MKMIGRLLVLVVLLFNVVMLLGLSVHVVKSGRTVKVVAKDHLTLVDTYNDVTNWSSDDVQHHPLLVGRLMETGRLDMIPAANNAAATNSSSPLDALQRWATKH